MDMDNILNGIYLPATNGNEWDKELIFKWVGANFVIEWEQSFICGKLLSCVTVAGVVVALAAR